MILWKLTPRVYVLSLKRQFTCVRKKQKKLCEDEVHTSAQEMEEAHELTYRLDMAALQLRPLLLSASPPLCHFFF